ncbi:hypothetical protein [Methanocorpusculum vombati]|uniref:Archaeal Type IV pilin N-terminal domain-containing protein n=1 Tax=Methanocorpusculum vombati TaxID=3002864 RepID=A0ABT4IMS8_9EURY|nr:hypothetical protein [Methanocorpusculum vombati]MCZ9318902.1 hypothetical protein [Methanocorpusculum sp.]MCZ0863069.1 hypothetical protein [Methanocorpusculum vombati]MDE2520292.1 hypothetical protein [Methanocorpusculum sp.]MDE2534641.1 hypothetical protein [Methanocorpusculum sp.]MDE2547023.1 hypothetical protein [Methanocorpusculum sp.]
MKDTADAGHGSPGSIAIVVVLVIAVVCMLVFIGSFMVENLVETEFSVNGVDLMVRISGDDVVAVVVGGDQAASLSSVDVYFYGREDLRYSFTPVKIMEPMRCTGMAKELMGWQTVITEGLFMDGKREVLGYTRLRFA